ncbi:MAG: AAA family ATPase [Candidatus Bilamarchaeaceae archaeon]
MLVIICGLPGTGKSTLAKTLAEKIGAATISSDSIRMQILEQRTYSEKEKEIVYEEMFKKAGNLLANGKSVILDATFYKKNYREKAKAHAEKAKTDFFIIECTTDERVLKKRLFSRTKKTSESEADFAVYKKVKELFEPISEPHLTVDTSLPLEKQVQLVEKYLGVWNEREGHQGA